MRALAGTALVAVALVLPAGAASVPDALDDLVLHRVFLRDGSALVSYGEYARVGDRVVFSMPVDPDVARLRLQLVSVPDALVDWPRTEEYTQALRARIYVATRAEADFAAMSAEVARLLTDIRAAPDPAVAADLARRAHARLIEWPRANYGYREEEVRQIAVLLEEAISELRVASGAEHFDFSLVAMTRRPPPPPLIRRPGLREAIEQALTASRLTPDPAERLALARSVVAVIDGRGTHAELASLREEALATIDAEERIDRAYADVTRSMIALADTRAAQADVPGVEKVVAGILAEDDRLGRQRPQVVAALLSAVEARLAMARQLQRQRDDWQARLPQLRAYRSGVRRSLDRLSTLVPALQELRAGRLPGTWELVRAIDAGQAAVQELSRLDVPDELRPAHALLTSALQLAASAARLRHEGLPEDPQVARDASSAAAGALMLAERARAELDRAIPDGPLPMSPAR